MKQIREEDLELIIKALDTGKEACRDLIKRNSNNHSIRISEHWLEKHRQIALACSTVLAVKHGHFDD